jgi:uncharacterized membrane protein
MELIHNLIPLLYILFLNVTKPRAAIAKESYKAVCIDLTVFVDLYKYFKQTVGFGVLCMLICS